MEHRGGAELLAWWQKAFGRHLLAAPASSPPRDAVTLAVRLANVEILEKGKSGNADFEGMGSTVVIAMVRQNGNQLELTTAHVGDSLPICYQRNGKPDFADQRPYPSAMAQWGQYAVR